MERPERTRMATLFQMRWSMPLAPVRWPGRGAGQDRHGGGCGYCPVAAVDGRFYQLHRAGDFLPFIILVGFLGRGPSGFGKHPAKWVRVEKDCCACR